MEWTSMLAPSSAAAGKVTYTLSSKFQESLRYVTGAVLRHYAGHGHKVMYATHLRQSSAVLCRYCNVAAALTGDGDLRRGNRN